MALSCSICGAALDADALTCSACAAPTGADQRAASGTRAQCAACAAVLWSLAERCPSCGARGYPALRPRLGDKSLGAPDDTAGQGSVTE